MTVSSYRLFLNDFCKNKMEHVLGDVRGMLTFFPEFYEGELLYSVFARYHVRSGHMSQTETMRTLFGPNGIYKNATPELPNQLSFLHGQVNHFKGGTIEKWIHEHTFFPYYTAFTNEQIRKKVYDLMVEGAPNGVSLIRLTGSGAANIRSSKYFRYCPRCLQEDISVHGESYWRVMHQLPSVLVCPIHEVPLHNSRVPYRSIERQNYFPATVKDCKGSSVIPNLNETTYQHIIDLAKQSAYLLKKSLYYNYHHIQERYYILLQQKGYVTVGGIYRQKILHEDLIEFYTNAGLSLFQSDLSKQNETWLKSLLIRKNYICHPIRHLLLLHFLGENVFSIEGRGRNKKEYFGKGPFPCLNKAAIHYLTHTIQKVDLEYCERRKCIIGVFRCSCGFVYTRVHCENQSVDPNIYNNVRDYGDVWKRKVLEERERGKTLQEIGKGLGVHRVTIREHLKKYASEAIKRKMDEDILQERRRYFLHIKEQYPNDNVTQLRYRNPAVYNWLIRHDREWLLLNQPIIKKEKRFTPKYICWEERDKEVLEELKLVVKRLKLQHKPVRISKTRLGRETKYEYLLRKHLEKLPCTQAFLKKVIETVKDFQIRRIRWAAIQVYNSGKRVSAYQIRVKAGFLNPKNLNEQLWEEIYRQVDEFLCR